MVSTTSGEPQRPALSLTTLVCLVVANMIGVGVFTSSGFALSSLGNPGRVILGWLIAGVWAICGAVAYGALAKRVPLSGGEYVFLSRLMHPALGFLAGWISLIAGFTAPIAASAKGVAAYSLPSSADPILQNVVASGIILLVCIFYTARFDIGVFAQNAVVILKLSLFVVLFVWAFGFSSEEGWRGATLPDRSPEWWPQSLVDWTVMFDSMVWLALAYTGFNAAVYVAGRSEAAQRNVPRAMLLATLLVTVIYVLSNIIFVWAPDSVELTASPASMEAVAALASRSLGGAPLEWLVRTTIILAVLSSVFSQLLAGPHVYWQMARDGVMPRWFDTDKAVPRVAIVVQTLLSMVVVWLGTLQQLIGYLGLTLSICSSLAIAALWCPRRMPMSLSGAAHVGEERRDFTQAPLRWYEHLSAAIYILVTMLMVCASVSHRLEQLIAAAATFALGLIVYAAWQPKSAQ